MYWTEEALKELEKVPEMFRQMAKMSVEDLVLKQGRKKVEAVDVKKAYQDNFASVKYDKDKEKIKIGIIRCEIVAEVCPGVACFNAYNRRSKFFAEYGENTEIIGFVTCGGCPGRRVFRLVDSMKKHGLNVVHLSSCMLMETGYPKCPHYEEIKKVIESKEIKVIEGTHH